MPLYEACKYSWKNFRGALENRKKRESLAQQIFPRLQYVAEWHYMHTTLTTALHNIILAVLKYERFSCAHIVRFVNRYHVLSVTIGKLMVDFDILLDK